MVRTVGVGASTTLIVGRGLAPAVPPTLGEVSPKVTERVSVGTGVPDGPLSLLQWVAKRRFGSE